MNKASPEAAKHGATGCRNALMLCATCNLSRGEEPGLSAAGDQSGGSSASQLRAPPEGIWGNPAEHKTVQRDENRPRSLPDQ